MMRPRIICTYASETQKEKSLNTQQQIKITITMYNSLRSHPNNRMSTTSSINSYRHKLITFN